MDNRKLLRTGIMGSVIAALCCFTPVLAILPGVVGLSALTGFLDYVLIPALVFFIGLALYTLYREQKTRRHQACCDTHHRDGINS